MLSVFVVAIVVEKIPVYQCMLMGLGAAFGGGGRGVIIPISQSIFGLNPSTTENSNEE